MLRFGYIVEGFEWYSLRVVNIFELESSLINDKHTAKRFLNSIYENIHSMDSRKETKIENRLLRQKRIWRIIKCKS